MSLAVVLDGQVFLHALVSGKGSSFAILKHVETGSIELVTSPVILQELRDVLSRPTVCNHVPGLTPERIDSYLRKVASLSTLVTEVLPLVRLPRDPELEPYLNLALTVGVPYLVSQEPTLLGLMADVAFRSANPTLTILDPAAFIKRPGVTAPQA